MNTQEHIRNYINILSEEHHTDKELHDALKKIKWLPLSILPGNAIEMVQKIGSVVFQQFGEVSPNDVYTISTMTHDIEDIEIIKEILSIYNAKIIVFPTVMDFSEIIQGYHPTVSIWYYLGYYYKMVKDTQGEYIYKWKPIAKH